MKWLWLVVVPGGSVIAIGLVIRWWMRRDADDTRVSDAWLHQRRQTHGYEFS